MNILLKALLIIEKSRDLIRDLLSEPDSKP